MQFIWSYIFIAAAIAVCAVAATIICRMMDAGKLQWLAQELDWAKK